MPKKSKDKIISRRKPTRIGKPNVALNTAVQARMIKYNTCGNDIKPQVNPFKKVETAITDEKKKFNYDNIFERANPRQKKKK
jgi:hypothetical protein